MPASNSQRALTAQRRSRAFQLYCSGVILEDIGAELGISGSACARLIKQEAKSHPAASMTREERSAVALQMLFDAHRDVKQELQQARDEGRREDVRCLLATQSLSASRCARVLEQTPEVQVNAAPVCNLSAFAALTGGGEQQQLPSEPVQEVTVEVEKA